MLAYDYPLLSIFWSLFIFFGFILWIWVLVAIFADLFRSRDIGGVAKTLWFLLVLLIPLFGALVYLLVRGRSMQERSIQDAKARDAAFGRYVQDTAGSGSGTSTADELTKLAALAENGTITQQEFAEQKNKLLGGRPTAA